MSDRADPLLIIGRAHAGLGLFASQLAVMVFVFGSIPFTDAMIVRYVDDRLRSRVAGMRLTVRSASARSQCGLLGPLGEAIASPPHCGYSPPSPRSGPRSCSCCRTSRRRGKCADVRAGAPGSPLDCRNCEAMDRVLTRRAILR